LTKGKAALEGQVLSEKMRALGEEELTTELWLMRSSGDNDALRKSYWIADKLDVPC
jgi:hypothetical protein